MAGLTTSSPVVVDRGNRWLRLGATGLVLAAVIAFLLANRSELPATARAVRDATPGFVLLALMLSAAYVIAYSGLLRSCLQATGYRVAWRRALKLGPAVHFSNMAVPNSGGLGGLPLLLADANQSRQPKAPAVLGYAITAQLGHIVFALVLACAIPLALLTGELTRLELLAAGVFFAYTAIVLFTIIAAVTNQRLFFWLHALPGRAKAYVRHVLRRPPSHDEGGNPEELFQSMRMLVREPGRFVRPAAWAMAIEVIGVATVWASLRAAGQPAGLVTPLLAYAMCVLFSTVGFLPAGLGFAEAGLGLALTQSGVPGQAAAVSVVIFRLCDSWIPLAVGALSLHSLPHDHAHSRVARPGMRGALQRRIGVSAALSLGLLNIFLAAMHRPLLHIGPLHEHLPHVAVQSSRYALLASGVALVASSGGLLHGKRQAWLVSVAAIGAALIAHPFKRADYLGIAANGAVLALLIALAPSFPARSDPARARQGLVWFVLGELGVLVYGITGLYLLDRHFAGQSTLLDSFEDGVRLLFVLPSTTINPTTRHGAWFVDSVRSGAIVVLLISLYHLLHPVLQRTVSGRDERRRVAELLDRYAVSCIAYFHLLPDKSYFFASSGDAFIGYRLLGHTAVALGEPVGEPQARALVVREFAEFCDLNGWRFCFHQVSPRGAEELEQWGLQAIKIGEEAVVPVQSFALAGKSFKHLRNEVNRLTRDGYTLETHRAPLAEGLIDELAAVSDAWLADGSHRERSFSVGMFTRAYVRSCDVLLVRSPAGTVAAFANIVPGYQSQTGNFDMMRRSPDAADGVMDFLFVGLIDHFKSQGLLGMSIGLAPLANIEGSGIVPAALRLLYDRAGQTFNFRGLRAFKDKWKPDWEPRFLVYRSDVQLPALTLAVARAGERSGRLPLPGWRRSARPA